MFAGALDSFFPLHEPSTRENLTHIWGNYRHLIRFRVKGKPPEYVSHLAYNDPQNKETTQIAWLWQPIGEVRDYFGDEVRTTRACSNDEQRLPRDLMRSCCVLQGGSVRKGY